MFNGKGINVLTRIGLGLLSKEPFEQLCAENFLSSLHKFKFNVKYNFTVNSAQTRAALSPPVTNEPIPQICGFASRHLAGTSDCQRMEDLNEKLTSTVITEGQEAKRKEGCIFCSIATGTDTKNKIIYQNSEVVVFHDIRPASREHLLVIPSNHIGPVKGLVKEDKPKLEYLFEVGKAVLEKRGGDISQSRCGFHWPPFHSIEHLHLHIIFPATEMTFLKRQIYRPNSLWFATYDWTLEWLEKQSNKKVTES